LIGIAGVCQGSQAARWARGRASLENPEKKRKEGRRAPNVVLEWLKGCVPGCAKAQAAARRLPRNRPEWREDKNA